MKENKIDKLFTNALNNGVFPGGSFAFSKWENGAYKRETNFYGYTQLEPEKKELKRDTIFDLASLTKPLSTVPLLLTLFEKDKINIETNIRDIYPACPADKSQITIGQLMSHSSGLPAHKEYFHTLKKLPDEQRKKQLLATIFEEALVTTPGTKSSYSDLGYMLLGFIIEEVTGESLAKLANDFLYSPLGLTEDLFYPPYRAKEKLDYASTEKCLWSGIMLNGKVHDDNCRVMGGVAGHAGLFGTLHGVLARCEQILDQWKGRGEHPAYSNELLQRILEPVGNSGWTMGFDMVSDSGSSSGNFFSKKSVGHLGFTGTSFWIDPMRECIIILLTNRVHPTRENWKIKAFRPVFHDLLMKELGDIQ